MFHLVAGHLALSCLDRRLRNALSRFSSRGTEHWRRGMLFARPATPPRQRILRRGVSPAALAHLCWWSSGGVLVLQQIRHGLSSYDVTSVEAVAIAAPAPVLWRGDWARDRNPVKLRNHCSVWLSHSQRRERRFLCCWIVRRQSTVQVGTLAGIARVLPPMQLTRTLCRVTGDWIAVPVSGDAHEEN